MGCIFIRDGVVAATQAEVAYLELTVGVNEEISGLQITVDDTRGVNVLHAPQDLVGKVLDVLVGERLAGSDDLVKVSCARFRIASRLHDSAR